MLTGRCIRLHRKARQYRPTPLTIACLARSLVTGRPDDAHGKAKDPDRRPSTKESRRPGGDARRDGLHACESDVCRRSTSVLVRHEFAALVLDIKMPGMNGIELATLIKQRKRSEHIPILFLTAHSVDERDVLRGYGVGAVDYLSNPVNAAILRSKVGVFVDLFRKTRALANLNDALQREVTERERAQQ